MKQVIADIRSVLNTKGEITDLEIEFAIKQYNERLCKQIKRVLKNDDVLVEQAIEKNEK